MRQWAGYRDREKSFDCAVRWRRAASLSFVTHQLFMNPSETFEELRVFLTHNTKSAKLFHNSFSCMFAF
jgi:hypothetical protein